MTNFFWASREPPFAYGIALALDEHDFWAWPRVDITTAGAGEEICPFQKKWFGHSTLPRFLSYFPTAFLTADIEG